MLEVLVIKAALFCCQKIELALLISTYTNLVMYYVKNKGKYDYQKKKKKTGFTDT